MSATRSTLGKDGVWRDDLGSPAVAAAIPPAAEPPTAWTAEATVTAWQSAFESIEAHIQDRMAMRDPASPETYLEIIRGEVEDVLRHSKQIVAARWADSARQGAPLEEAAQWMIAHSYATGPGDSISDLLAELVEQVREHARREGIDEAAIIFDKRAEIHAANAVWMGPQRQRYEGARRDGVEMSPMNGPALSHDAALQYAAEIRALAKVPA